MYTKTKNYNNSEGFTLVETLLALTLGVMISGMLILTVNPGIRHMRELQSAERLHANAIRTADTLAFEIKQSDEISLAGTSILELHTSDGTVKRMELTNGQIIFDNAPLTDPKIRVDSLNFRELSRSVKIDIQLTYPETGRTSSYSTTIAHRNTI